MNLSTPQNNINDAEKTETTVAAELEHPVKAGRQDTDTPNMQNLLAKATRDAELAKTAVRKAITQAFKEREESLKKAETMAESFDEAILSSSAPVTQTPARSAAPAVPIKSTEYLNKMLVKKALSSGNNTQSAFADIIKTYFASKQETETRKDAVSPVNVQNKNPHPATEHAADDQSQNKTSRIIVEAKSDRIASRVVVNQAQDEIRKAREEAEMVKRTAEAAVSRAREEADTSRKEAEEAVTSAKNWIEQAKNEIMAEKKAAGLIASQAQQEALSQAAEEIKKAKGEVNAAKEAANTAIRLAKEEVSRSREEAETYRKNSLVAIAALEDKILKITEKVKTIKQQSLISISEAQAEAQKANEEARKTRFECETLVKQAEAEKQKATEEARLEIMKARETIIQSEKRAYDQVREQMDRVKEEAEKTRHSAYEAVIKAQEEARLAREEAKIIQLASEDAVGKAIEQKRKTEEEAEKAKQTMLEFVTRAQDESRKARDEAEVATIRANDAMIKAQQDIIGMTINEISATRQELEDAVNNPANLMKDEPENKGGQSSRYHPDVMNTLLREMRTPLHSISGFARLMLDEDIDDAATRREFLAIVVQQSENMTQLLDDLSGKAQSIDDNTPADTVEQSA